jgi:hypothetical protein
LRITTVSTSVAKGILNFMSQYKYYASGISPFFGRVPKLSKNDYFVPRFYNIMYFLTCVQSKSLIITNTNK